MFRLTLRSLRLRWARLTMTALAIIASTAFLSGTFIFRDTIQRTYDALFADVYERVDSFVQSPNTVEIAFGFEARDRLPSAVLDQVRGVAGVGDAQAYVQGDAVVIAKDGTPIERPTGPTFGAAINSGVLSMWHIVDGRAPTAAAEVALERTTAADGDYRVGDQVKVNAEGGSRSFTLVGIAEYNSIAAPSNGTWALFDDATAEDFVARPGFVDGVLVRGDGTVDGATLTARLGAALDPAHAEALTRAQITAQTQSQVEQALGFVTLFLSIFSLIALGVGAFVIYNVFSITAAQREREHALLRAIGASRRQVTLAMLGEALAIGLIGSLLGLLGGIGLAVGIRALLDAFGFTIPSRGLSLRMMTPVITIVAGVLATLVAGLAPAISSGRVPPVAAMAATGFERVDAPRSRTTAAVVAVLGGVGLVVGVLAGMDAIWLGVAALLIFVGVILIGPVMAKPVARWIGAPVQWARGVTGEMARGNVLRNPRRTARTAAPVLIGVALVTGATVFAASIKSQLTKTVGATFLGDYAINSTNGGALSFSQDFIDQLNQLPEVSVATGLGFARVEFADGQGAFGSTIDPATAATLVNYDFVAGSFTDLTVDGLLVSEGEAKRRDLHLGSTLDIRLDDRIIPLRVEGIYRADQLAQARVFHRDLFRGSSVASTAGIVVLTRAAGVSDGEFRRVVGAAVTDYGIGELQNRDEFVASRADIVDQSLTFIYGLLAFSVVIAAAGIVLTLLLAVYERRRETGLLRAVGMSRSQVRATVRWESVITSVYGAAVGVVLGLVLGYVVIVALRDEGLTTYTVPVSRIALIMAIAFVAGVLAAVIPARRATKIEVLRALASE